MKSSSNIIQTSYISHKVAGTCQWSAVFLTEAILVAFCTENTTLYHFKDLKLIKYYRNSFVMFLKKFVSRWTAFKVPNTEPHTILSFLFYSKGIAKKADRNRKEHGPYCWSHLKWHITVQQLHPVFWGFYQWSIQQLNYSTRKANFCISLATFQLVLMKNKSSVEQRQNKNPQQSSMSNNSVALSENKRTPHLSARTSMDQADFCINPATASSCMLLCSLSSPKDNNQYSFN